MLLSNFHDNHRFIERQPRYQLRWLNRERIYKIIWSVVISWWKRVESPTIFVYNVESNCKIGLWFSYFSRGYCRVSHVVVIWLMSQFHLHTHAICSGLCGSGISLNFFFSSCLSGFMNWKTNKTSLRAATRATFFVFYFSFVNNISCYFYSSEKWLKNILHFTNLIL